MRVNRFEDLVAWQKARALTSEIYKVTASGRFGKDYALARQIQSASVSIMSNIAEGFDRHGSAEFHHFVSLAHGSSAEVQSHLYVALDVGYIAADDFQRLFASATEVRHMLAALRASLKRAAASEKLRATKRPQARE